MARMRDLASNTAAPFVHLLQLLAFLVTGGKVDLEAGHGYSGEK